MVEMSTLLVSMGGTAANLTVRRDSLTSLTSHNKQTFQRLLGSFRTVVGSRDDASDTLSCELLASSAVWLSGSALISIYKVTLHWARLVVGWVAYHLSILTGSQANSASYPQWDIVASDALK